MTDFLDGADLLSHALNVLHDDSEDEMQRRIGDVNNGRGVPRNNSLPRAAVDGLRTDGCGVCSDVAPRHACVRVAGTLVSGMLDRGSHFPACQAIPGR